MNDQLTKQLMKNDKLRRIFMSSEDNVRMKQILATHNPKDFARDIDVKPILQITEDVFKRSILHVGGIVLGLAQPVESLDEKSHEAIVFAMLEAIATIIDRNFCEASLEALRRKNVLLLISNLDMSQDELSILEQIYNESRQHATGLDSLYEIVWMPILDPSVTLTDPLQKKFEDLQSTLAWYTVAHPKMIEQSVIRFVRERWHFRNKPILVVLDPQGRVLSPNAIHMMWIWGSNAFPFTSAREEALWKDETWTLELLVNGIDPTILNWIKEGKYIYLYGGDDIKWIRRFTTTARKAASAAGIELEMVYVRKSSNKEQVRKAINVIADEKLSATWQELMIWFFWTRLESMLLSKLQLGMADDVDPMTQEIKKLLSFDKSGRWALLSRGSEVVVNGPSSLERRKEFVPVRGFDRLLMRPIELQRARPVANGLPRISADQRVAPVTKRN